MQKAFLIHPERLKRSLSNITLPKVFHSSTKSNISQFSFTAVSYDPSDKINSLFFSSFRLFLNRIHRQYNWIFYVAFVTYVHGKSQFPVYSIQGPIHFKCDENSCLQGFLLSHIKPEMYMFMSNNKNCPWIFSCHGLILLFISEKNRNEAKKGYNLYEKLYVSKSMWAKICYMDMDISIFPFYQIVPAT